MIKNIIFDLGNVIINYNQEKIISNFAKSKEESIFIKEQIFNSPEWKLLDLGEITNNEAIIRIKERNNSKYINLTEVFLHEWYKIQPINEDIVRIARKLKEANYNIYVLSNMANETFEYFKDIDFFKLCDGIVISAKEKIKKPDEKVFRILLDRYNLKPEECLFIDDDDTNKSYVTANSIGICGRKVIPNNYEDILKLLKEYKVINEGEQ